MQQMKAVIQPTEGMERIVKPGETTVIGYGSPYKFDQVRDRRQERDGRRENQILARWGGVRPLLHRVLYVDVGVRRKGGKRANANMRMKPVVDNLDSRSTAGRGCGSSSPTRSR